MSLTTVLALVLGLLAVLAVSPVAAATADLTATLSGDQEVPPVATAATGSATVSIDTDAASGSQLCYDLTSTALEGGAVVGAHIHEGAAGANGSVVVTLQAAIDGSGSASSACAPDSDIDFATAGDADVATLLADIAANPANYYVNVHTESNPGGEIRGQLAAAPTPTPTPTAGRDVTVQVMKHNCANVATMAEFEAVEARAATNPTTPDAAFGTTVETVLECPTVVLDGDAQTPGAVAGGTSTFDFTVADGGSVQTLSTDSTYTQAAACETDVMYDANRNGSLDAGVCLDLSDYDFTTADGTVTVTETAPPSGFAFGALRFTPGSGDEAALVSAANGVIVLDTTADDDGSIMLHVYNFATAAGGTAAPTPAASALPDAAISADGSTTGTQLALILGGTALIGFALIGRTALRTRRTR
ncbi:MAG: CHRD domain-containing protein [Candidatus Limnocylindria bacterium]